MKTVSIFGCGISGLAAAHELVEKGGYKVNVYEKLSEPGGLARSYRSNSFSTPSEYSWRGYGPFYYNVFNLMKRIPIDNNKTVYDNLSDPLYFIFTENGGDFLNGLSWQDTLVFSMIMIKIATAGKERTSYYASINASDYMKSRMSDRGWKQFNSMIGPWVGIDPQRGSLYHIMFFMILHYLPNSQNSSFYDKYREFSSGDLNWSVLNKPTSEGWFNPWVTYLEKMGVKFHFNQGLKTIKIHNNKVYSVIVKNESDDYQYSITSDHYIMALSPFGMRDVLKESIISSEGNSKDLLIIFNQFKKLTQDGPHIQVSFQLGFNKNVSWVGERRPLILSNSEFNITLYRQDEVWGKDVFLGSNIKSLWSGTACVSYIPGALFGKPLSKLTKIQFKEEILYQIGKDIRFNDILRKKTGKSFDQLLPYMIHFDSWKNWNFSSDGITIIEPKYVDSTNTRPYQPDTKTSIVNLWMAGAHTKTSTDLWGMEAAAESGRKAADMITGNDITIKHTKWSLLKYLEMPDDSLYKIGAPNVIYILLISIIVIFICIFSLYINCYDRFN
jgi:hypothetical protein